MIRRTDNFIQPAISSTIEPSELETSKEVKTADTAPVERELVSHYQDGGASLIWGAGSCSDHKRSISLLA